MQSSPGTQNNPFAIGLVLAVLALFVLGDLLIFALWLIGTIQKRPLLNRYWSLADVFLGLQATLAVVIGISIIGYIVLFVVDARALRNGTPDMSSPSFFFTVLWPAMLAQQVALILVPLGFVWLKYGGRIHDLGWEPNLKRGLRLLGLGALLVVPLLPMVELVELVVQRVIFSGVPAHYRSMIEDLAKQANAVTLLDGVKRSPLLALSLVLIIGIIGPIAEEVFFRGFAYRAFKERLGKGAALVLSALLFAAIHGNPLALFPIFLIGLLLAYIYERTGSLAAPIGLHCANNLMAVLFFFLAPDFSIWGRLFGK